MVGGSRRGLGCFLLVSGLVLLAPRAWAQAAPAVPSAAPAPAVRASAIQVGFEERVRTENWDDIVDHDAGRADARHQWRFRTRVWAEVPLGGHLSFHVGLDNESKRQGEPRLPLTRDETVFESLYLDVRPGDKLSARIGRQNLARGDGFILWDGTGADGSRTAYLNAVNVAYLVAPKARLELIGASDPVHDVDLPVITDKQKVLTEWDERLAGVYFTDTRLAKTDLQAYYFWKSERNDYRPATNPQHQPDRTVNTIGVRLARELGPGWKVVGEAAAQRGHAEPSATIRAWAGSVNLRRAFDRRWKPALLVGYSALSGDDPATATVEQWEPVASRWPKWSDLYVYSLGAERGTAFWTNLGLWQADATLSPTPRVSVRGSYCHLTAFHPFAGSASTFGQGTTRGDLVLARMDLALHASLKAHVLYERLVPGRFYTGTAPGHFFRMEFSYTFLKSFALGRAASTPTP